MRRVSRNMGSVVTRCWLAASLCIASHTRGAPATEPAVPPNILKDAASFLRDAGSYRFTSRTKSATRPSGETSELTCFIRLPDRLHVQRSFYGGLLYYYNGKTFTGFSMMEKQYGVVEAPPTIAALLQTRHNPGLRDFMVLLAVPDHPMWNWDWKEVGLQKLDGADCHVVRAEMPKGFGPLELWIDAGPKPLVKRMVRKRANDVTDLEWEVPADLPDPVFEFTPPPGAVLAKPRQRPATVPSNERATARDAAQALLNGVREREEAALVRVIAPGKHGSPEERAKQTLERKGKLAGLLEAIEGGVTPSVGEERPGKPEEGRELVRVFIDALDTRTKDRPLRKNVAVLDVLRFDDGWRVDDWTLLASTQ